MDKLFYRKKSTEEINRICLRCMRIVLYFLVLFYISIFIIGRFDTALLITIAAICITIVLIPCIIIPVFRMYSLTFTRHIIILSTVLLMGVILTEFTTLAFAAVLFPILLASMYYNRTFVLFTLMLESAIVIIAGWAQIYYPDYILRKTFHTPEEVFLQMIFPLLFTLILMSSIAFFIVSRNSQMIDKYMETAITMQENEKYLIYAFSEMSESKSLETGEHIKRVAEYVRILGRASGFDEEYTEKVATAAMMHDIGKLMIPEDVLDKPGKLTEEEFNIMKSHVLYGEALLKNCPGEIMKLAAIMAKEHHERWDGSGYLGMKGNQIAYISRLIALADVFDALTAVRSYKRGWTFDEAYEEIVKSSGKHFDPKVVRLFIQNRDQFRKIHEEIPDKTIRNQ